MSKFVAILKSGKTNPLAIALPTLLNSLNPYEKNLLYFISSFRPPEVSRLWYSSFLVWKKDDTGYCELGNSFSLLRELSLLEKVPGTDTYKQQAGVIPFIAEMLQATDRPSPILKEIKSYVEEHRIIPDHRLAPEVRRILTSPRHRYCGRSISWFINFFMQFLCHSFHDFTLFFFIFFYFWHEIHIYEIDKIQITSAVLEQMSRI